MHITRDETAVPLRTGRAVLRVVEVNPGRAMLRVEVSHLEADPTYLRVYVPRNRPSRNRPWFDRWPLVGDVVRFDGLCVQLVTVKDRCRWAVLADRVEVVDRVAA